MAVLPLGILSLPIWQAVDDNGDVLPGAKLTSYEPGGTFSTLKFLKDAATGGVDLTNPVVADAGGRFVGMFLQNDGYDMILTDANDVEIWRVEGVEDIAGTFFNQLGSQEASGSFDVNSPYTIIAGDWLVTSDAGDATDPFIFQLPPLIDWTTPLTIKHFAPTTADVTPDGTDKIEGVAAAFSMPAASGVDIPTLTLVPGAASWYIQSSHAVT